MSLKETLMFSINQSKTQIKRFGPPCLDILKQHFNHTKFNAAGHVVNCLYFHSPHNKQEFNKKDV